MINTSYEEITINILSRFEINRGYDIIFDIKVNNANENSIQNNIIMKIGSTYINLNKNGYFPFNKLNPLLQCCLQWSDIIISTNKPINITYKQGFIPLEIIRYLRKQRYLVLQLNYPMSKYYVINCGTFGKNARFCETIKCLDDDVLDKVYNMFNKIIFDISMIPDLGIDYLIAQECFNSIIS